MADRFGFLRSGRWLGLIAGGLALAALFVFLGRWQYGRYEAKVERAQQVERAWGADALTIDDVLADGLTVTPDVQWRPVNLVGQYVPHSGVALRNRPVDGTPASHALALFAARYDGGTVGVVVDRGWLPAAAAENGVPQPPAGEREITVRLRVEEAPVDRARPAAQVYSLHTGQVLASMSEAAGVPEMPVLQGNGQAELADAPLSGFPRPDTGLGSHLSYAFQWWFFAAAVPVGLVVLARRESNEAAAEPRPRRRRGGAAEAEEDALIDAQLRP